MNEFIFVGFMNRTVNGLMDGRKIANRNGVGLVDQHP